MSSLATTHASTPDAASGTRSPSRRGRIPRRTRAPHMARADPAMSRQRLDSASDGPAVIVVGVDGSEHSMRAVSYAVGLCRRQNSQLIAIYVRQMRGLPSTDPQVLAACTDADNDTIRVLGAFLADARERFSIRASLLVRVGDPTKEIMKVADAEGADAVVVGASAKAGHNLLGSTGVKLVRAAGWPVTVVP